MEKEKFFPFYKTYLQGGQMQSMEEIERNDETVSVFAGDAFLQDWEDALMRSYYPPHIQRMQEITEGDCDELDYEGSMIYDECPDRVRLGLARDRIFDRMRQDSVPEAINQEDFAKDVAETLLYQEILARRALGKR